MTSLPQLDHYATLDRPLPTPALVVYADIVHRNVERLIGLAREHGVKLRPHLKTHKSDELAGWQRAAGASGVTVGTFEEARYFVDAGHTDVFIACPPVGVGRAEALAVLAREADPIVSVDSLATVAVVDSIGRSVGRPIRYYWEMDGGFGRYGSPPRGATVDAVARAQHYKFAHFAGLMNFSGAAYSATAAGDVARLTVAEAEHAVETASLISDRGFDVAELSVGSTPSAASLLALPAVTELRAGTYIFNDATQVALGAADWSDCAQVVCTTVMSSPGGNRIVVDAGSKALPKEMMSSLTTGYGVVLGYPWLTVERVSEEASVLTWSPHESGDVPKVGDQLQIVSNHCCSATYLFSHFWLVESGELRRLAIGARTR